MNCPHCNQPIEEGTSFCGRCGGKIDPPAEPRQDIRAAQPPQQPPQYYPPENSRGADPQQQNNNKTVIIVSIVSMAVIALVLIFVFLILPAIQDANRPTANTAADDIEEMVVEEIQQAQALIDAAAEGLGSGDDAPAAAEYTEQPAEQPTARPAAQSSSFYLIPDSDRRYISVSDLYGLSDDEVQLARNEIYARYGYDFRTRSIQIYFERQGWYRNNPYYGHDAQSPSFNKYERANVSLIKDYEKSRGWDKTKL